jgi:hypothetical protein
MEINILLLYKIYSLNMLFSLLPQKNFDKDVNLIMFLGLLSADGCVSHKIMGDGKSRKLLCIGVLITDKGSSTRVFYEP